MASLPPRNTRFSVAWAKRSAGFLAENYPTVVRRVGVKDVFGESGQAQELLDKYGLRARDIVREAKEVLGRTKGVSI